MGEINLDSTGVFDKSIKDSLENQRMKRAIEAYRIKESK